LIIGILVYMNSKVTQDRVAFAAHGSCYRKGGFFVNPKSNIPSLSLSDLEISDVDIYGLTKEDALGVPELGASQGTYGCCTNNQQLCTA
jgi:hypothetical protein